jgi:hypothetical protein
MFKNGLLYQGLLKKSQIEQIVQLANRSESKNVFLHQGLLKKSLIEQIVQLAKGL